MKSIAGVEKYYLPKFITDKAFGWAASSNFKFGFDFEDFRDFVFDRAQISSMARDGFTDLVSAVAFSYIDYGLINVNSLEPWVRAVIIGNLGVEENYPQELLEEESIGLVEENDPIVPFGPINEVMKHKSVLSDKVIDLIFDSSSGIEYYVLIDYCQADKEKVEDFEKKYKGYAMCFFYDNHKRLNYMFIAKETFDFMRAADV